MEDDKEGYEEKIEEKSSLTPEEAIEVIREIIPGVDSYELDGFEYDEERKEWTIYLLEETNISPGRFFVVVDDKEEIVVNFNYMPRFQEEKSREKGPRYIMREEAEEIAKDFLEQVFEEQLIPIGIDSEDFVLEPGLIDISDTSHMYIDMEKHQIDFVQYAYDYPTNNAINLAVDSRTGDIVSYNLSIDRDLEFEEPKDLMDKEKAKDKFVKKGASLTYTPDHDTSYGDKKENQQDEKLQVDAQVDANEIDAEQANSDNYPAKLLYKPIVEEKGYLHGESKGLLDIEGKVLEEDEITKETPTPDVEKGAPSPEKLEELLTKEDAKEKGKELLDDLGMGDVSFSDINEHTYVATGRESKKYQLHYIKESTNSVETEVNTDIVLSFDRDYGYVTDFMLSYFWLESLEGIDETDKNEDFDKKELSKEYIKALAPEYYEYIELDSSPEVYEIDSYNDDTNEIYSFMYQINAYNIPVDNSYIRLEMCKDTGDLLSYDLSMPIFKDDIQKPEDIISEEKALELFLEDADISVEYLGEEPVFRFHNDQVEAIDAKEKSPKKSLNFIEKVKFPGDIEGHELEKELEWLAFKGVLVPTETDKLKPEKNLTRNEANNLVNLLIDYSYNVDHIEPGIMPEIVNEEDPPEGEVTRIELIEMVVRGLIDGNELDYEKDDFDLEKVYKNPDKEATREDAARLFKKIVNTI
ncbi:YcdB/YcdC domain-containing protein [Natranaerofaba carboxydovora]|uniref:YcdB/YcdC domain-containing protein n=1 Tax=Natranaerofaba carboxydovora TaxID=2742683 RepID=UPI001F142E7C|nr:YcdB/YcdC domain-containing protein [Natranaerofaba carboxydovora]UMZ74774.1 hypothetical protein ACONDI_02377 [Natranaerofaba carboxydovora]